MPPHGGTWQFTVRTLEKAMAASTNGSSDTGVRLAELVATLSIASDLGMGQPMEQANCHELAAKALRKMWGRAVDKSVEQANFP